MKTGIRIIICGVLIAAALALAGVTVASFTTASAASLRPGAWEGMYVLGEVDGNVAVFGRGDSKTPMAVTSIETATLRERDRELIAAGLPVASREELAQLLEDLGA